jgi:hypothetical protein
MIRPGPHYDHQIERGTSDRPSEVFNWTLRRRKERIFEGRPESLDDVDETYDWKLGYLCTF